MVAPPPDRTTPKPSLPGPLSILDGFLSSDNPVVQTIGRAVMGPAYGALPVSTQRDLIEGAAKVWDVGGQGLNFALGRTSTPLSAGPVALESAAKGVPVRQQDLADYTQKAAANSPGGASGPVAPIILGMYAAEKTWDYGVNRPIGTAALVTDPDSPLYNGKPIKALDENGQPIQRNMGEGFQMSDIAAAWNRTEQVSAGQALAANPIVNRVPGIGGVMPLLNLMGGIDKYDPWDDNQMSEAQNNPFYVAATGGTDLALQLVLPPIARAGRIGLMRKVGLTNTIRSAEELQGLRQAFDVHTPEAPNTWGMVVDDIAGETNPAKIMAHAEVANNVGANKWNLSRVLAETNDRSTVNEILLANKGDVQAIQNLAGAAPDIVWKLADADMIVQSNAVNGVPYRPVGPQLGKVNQVFDSALERNRYFGTLRDELTAPDGTLRVNSTWKPTSSIIVERIRTKGREVGYAARTGDWSEAPQWVQQTLTGRNGLVTARVQWAGSRAPLGHVSNSGARPDEKLAEFNAQMDSLPFMRGDRTVLHNGTEVNVAELRQRMSAWMMDHDDAALPSAWQEIENTVVDIAADHYGVDRAVAHKIAEAYRQIIDDTMQYARETNGYLFDEMADGGVARIVIDPQTLRQMLNSFQTLPMAEVIRAIKDESGVITQAANAGQDVGIAAYDAVSKVFRTAVLFRPGYTGKNSVIEPWISSFLAHGTILADEGLAAVAGNFTANTIRRVKRVAYIANVHKMIDKTLRTGDLQQQAKDLIAQRYDVQQVIDNALAELDSFKNPGYSPAARSLHTDEVRSILVNAQMKLESIEGQIDGILPEWRQIVEPATQAELRAKLMEFRAILGENPEYVASLEARILDIERAARARAGDGAEPKYTVNEKVELARMEAILDRIEDYKDKPGEEFAPGVDPDSLYSGYGPEWGSAGLVDVQRLLDMTGNEARASRLGAFDRSLMDEPVVVAFDPARGRMYVVDGNHRVLAAAEAGMENLPTRVVRANIDDAKVAEVEAEGGRVADVGVRKSPMKDEYGREAWPEEMRPTFAGLATEDSGPLTFSAALRPSGDSALRAQIDELQAMYDEIVAGKQSFEPKDFFEQLDTLQKGLADLDHRIGAVKGELSTRTGRNRRIGADLGAAGYRGSGEGMMTIQIGGESFEIPSAFSEREYTFGAGYRAEASAQRTNELTFDPSRTSYEVGRWRRSMGTDVLNPDSPLYWDELAHVGNRFFRSDRLVQMHLEGKSRTEIAKWLASDEGQAYQKAMGKDYLQRIDSYDGYATRDPLVDEPAPTGGPEITGISGPRARAAARRSAGAEPTPPTRTPSTFDRPFSGDDMPLPRTRTRILSSSTTQLDEVLRLVDQYFPDEAMRRRLAEGEVTAGELQEAMGARTDLSRIVGDDLNFHPERRNRVSNALTKALDKIWQLIATMPEDRLARWPFYVREFRNQIEARGRVLVEQGVKMTDEQWNTLRQASHRGALGVLEKTFYNIRRYNTPVYNSRFLMTFPGATFNSIYRYGRFLVREPERMLQYHLLAGDILRHGALNEEGEPVDDIRDAAYFLVPGTASEDSSGLKIPVNSFASLGVNYPSLGVGILLASSLSQRVQVKTAETIKEAVGQAAFDEMFPYGISDNPVSTISGGWQKDFWRAIQGESDEDVRRTVISIYGYSMYQWEKNGGQGDRPSMDDAIEEAIGYYRTSMMRKFWSPFSMMQSPEGDLLGDAWSEMQQEYGGDTQAARLAFTAKYGDAARWLTMPETTRTAYIPSTMEAHDRIWVEHPDLAKELVKIDPENPEYVALLAYGTDGEYSADIANFLRTNSLPGDDKPALENMDPATFESKAMQSQGWDLYSTGKVKYDAEHLRLATLRDDATSEFEKQYYRDKINGLDTEWDGWVAELEAANIPWAKQKNGQGEDTAKTATLYFNRILADPELSKDPDFQKVGAFLSQRDSALSLYAAATSNEQKRELKAQFTDYVTANFAKNDPQFASMWNRYYASEWDIAND